MRTRVPDWARLGVVVTMAAPQLVIGLWAVLAPQRWFESFPGFDPRLVAAEPPFNRHLVSDVGAGFLATGVALLAAAAWANRDALRVALLTYVAFTFPHVAYHVLHPADALSGAEDVLNVFALASGLVLAVIFWRAGEREAPADAGHAGAPRSAVLS